MQKILFLLFTLISSTCIFAQNTFKAVLKDEKNGEILAGFSVNIKGTTNGSISDSNGFVQLTNIANGKQNIIISGIDYTKKEINITFPQNETVVILLEASSDDLEEIKVVTSTRSSRNIKDIPTRIEGIPAADLDEKSVMQPGNIKMLVSEISGVQTQQTSQVSGSSSIRIQGLDGKYTQLLQDGFPLYSGFASGLSVLQIPPLNLKRVEVIKGSTSTLYGGGAIAGLINLITKVPTPEREISFLANINQTNALDLSAFYGKKYKKSGLTLFASSDAQKAYDANNDGFSDIPKYTRYSISPKFYYYPTDKTILSIGVNAGKEKRIGGDMIVINNKTDAVHTFYESNKSERYSTQASFEKIFSNKNILTVKNSIAFFNRKIKRKTYNFDGRQTATFSEINLLIPRDKSEWNIGANYVSDNFQQKNITSAKLNYNNTTVGLFAQNNLKVSEKFIAESGLRIDFTNRNNVFVLPRLSLLYKITDKLTSRIGGGLGYKMPNIFSEDAEEKAFQNITPLNFAAVKAEKSYGLNGDLNYKAVIFEDINFSVNQLFFYTIIKDPLVLEPVTVSNDFAFKNAQGNINTKGFETALKFKLEDISLYVGYTFTDVKRIFNNISTPNPLSAKHHLNIDLMYELNEKLRVGYELYYTGQQYLSTNKKVKDYWVTGLMSEYKLKHFSLFINFENFTDTRQSRWDNLYTGTIQNPLFKEVYTPTEGFIFNGGFKIKL